MKEKEIEETTRKKDGGSATLVNHSANKAVAADRADRRYGDFFRLLTELANRKERERAAFAGKRKRNPAAGAKSKTPTLAKRG